MQNFSLKDINVIDFFKLILSDWRRIIRNCFIAAIVAIVVAFSIPKSYESTVVLAPESGSSSSSLGSLGSLASMAGFNVANMQNNDAIYPELYPQILSSSNVLWELCEMDVESLDGDIDCTLYEYIKEHHKSPWWGYITKAPGYLLKAIKGEKDDTVRVTANTSYLMYTKEQSKIMKSLSEMITCSVDKGNQVITISATMQDPLISAQVADRISTILKEHVTEYRVGKANEDLKYSVTLFNEARDNYFKKQTEYAEYLDRHALGTLKNSVKTTEERLRDEAELAYAIYTQISQQMEIAKTKVQERTPVFTVMQPAVVPNLAASPRKLFILVSFLFLTFFGHVIWMLFVEKKK